MKIPIVAASALALISMTLNALQAFRISSLERQMEGTESVNKAIIGLDAAEITARDPEGRAVSIKLAGTGKPTVVYVFRPSCVWCLQNAEAFRSLRAQISKSYNVVGLSLDHVGLTAYARQHDMESIPIYSDPESGALRRYQLGNTPETIVVSNRGVILQDWRGAYVRGIGDSVQHFFGVHLPTVSNPESAELRPIFNRTGPRIIMPASLEKTP